MSLQNLSTILQNNDLKFTGDIKRFCENQSNICTENTIVFNMSHDFDSLSVNTSLLRIPKTKSLSCNIGSSISLDKFTSYGVSSGISKFLSNEAITNLSECINDELSDEDLIEIHNTPSNFKSYIHKKHGKCRNSGNKPETYEENSLFGRNLYYEDSLNDIIEFNTILDTQDDAYNIRAATTESDQSNIEQCLLDLDNYLEQMDENGCMQHISNDLNTNKIRLNKGVYSSTRDKSSLGIKSQFGRNSRLRNTIGCISNNKTLDHISNNGKEISKKGNTDINRETQHCSTNIDKSEDTEKCNNLKLRPMSFNGLQVLNDDTIFQNIIEQQEAHMLNNENVRPRQFGRRSERLVTITSTLNNENQNYEQSHINPRPISAPTSAIVSVPDVSSPNVFMCGISDGSTTRTSRNTSLISIESSTESGESSQISSNIDEPNNTVRGETNGQITHPDNSGNMDATLKSGFNSYWPHSYCRTLALVSCTLGLFNINRFAVLTINYGGNFLIQFIILSILFGIPFLWLQMSLGAKIKAGPITMWKISPICVGIGISLVFVQYIVTIYSSVAVVWILVYIKDIFTSHASYPWSGSIHPIIPRQTSHHFSNITESVPDYFNGYVLQRLYIFKGSVGNDTHLHINDRVAFYLAILWAIVFLILCKGLKSFGKIIMLLGLLPIVFLAAVAVKLLFIIDCGKLQEIFSSCEFDDFLINSKTWSAAAQEVFLTWGILGASVVAMSSRTHKMSAKLTLRSDAILVVVVTIIGLSLSALIGLCLTQVLNENGYMYVPGSYENPEHYSAIYLLKSPSRNLISYPTKYVPHYSSLIGEVYRRHTDIRNVSGYQVLRFVTEIVPAALAISTEKISWIWAVFIFVTFLVFGVSQLCVMWNPISFTLGNSTSAVLLSCVSGLLLSIPFATEIGITLLHYMDFLLGGAWFIPVLWVAEIFGVFLIRGRPYNADDLVNDLRMSRSISAFLALSWNVLLPIGLITLTVIEYKISLSNQLYYWRGKSYFSYWSRKVGALTQIGFLLLLPLTAIVQIYRYLSSGPPDILDRIQMLYRPLDEADNIQNNRNINSRLHDQNSENSTFRHLSDDEPPKYTPPPSYTTATGARLAKILRQSLRHSVRRILGDSGRPRPTLSIQREIQNEHGFHPPEYPSTSNNRNEMNATTHVSLDVESRPSIRKFYGRSLSLDRKRISKTSTRNAKSNNCDFNINRSSIRTLRDRPYTAEDVISILRSSTLGRRRAKENSQAVFRSIENLVQNAEPPYMSSDIIEDFNQTTQNSTEI